MENDDVPTVGTTVVLEPGKFFDPDTHDADACPECNPEAPPHVGHYSTFGTYWCDTCNSPYCELA